MAEWLIEQGIGEDRAALVDHGAIVAARLCWGEPWRAGAVAPARLLHRVAHTKRGTVRLPDGAIALVDGLEPSLTEGANLPVTITRAALAEQGRTKQAQARAGGGTPRPAPSLAEELAKGPIPVRLLRPLDRALDEAGWPDLIDEAQRGEIAFTGGSLTISPTPAMTLIDVDGPPPAGDLALRAVPAIAASLRRLDLAGSVGIDFPTPSERRERQVVDAALEAALEEAQWRGERTAMNGFGFVQLVSRLERPSLVARCARSPAAAAARVLLRQAERVSEPGKLLLCAHPLVLAAIDAPLEAELARRSGRAIERQSNPTLALTGGFAQAITP